MNTTLFTEFKKLAVVVASSVRRRFRKYRGNHTTGWPPNQGIQGKVREFTCCLKKVKNSQGKRHKNAAKSGKKH